MKRIRVLRVIARMNVGGPAVEIAELMRGLDPECFHQRLVTGWCSEDEADFLQTQALDVPATRLGGLGRSIRPWDDAMAFAGLIGEIRRFRPHVVHTHTAKAGALGRIAARISGVPTHVVHTHHGHLLSGYFGPVASRAVVGAERFLGALTDHMVAVGGQVRADLLQAGIGRPDRFSVIHSGVSLSGTATRAEARESLGISDQALVIAWVGRVTRIKRPDRLIEVARLVHARHRTSVFLVAGSGDQMPALAAEVSASGLPIRLLGWRDDVQAVFAASDLALLTSDNEGTPLSLAQAGLCGVPSVATRVGSVCDVVNDGHTGILTAPDARDLAQACMEMIERPELRTRMGVRAREFIGREFSTKSFLEAHALLYRELTGTALSSLSEA